MIPFNRPCMTGTELEHIEAAVTDGQLSGDGAYTRKCQQWFNQQLTPSQTLLTTSCSMALDMVALLLDIKQGDEVVMPSYTFVSTANSFVTMGANIRFVDIRPDTMNLDERLVEQAITPKTKAIVPVHYAGVSCEMDVINELAVTKKLMVIEDAAQGMMARYKGNWLGTLGTMGTYSFHATKNYTAGGEGGLLIVNDSNFGTRAEIIREKGTNRSQFFRGQVDKYTWIDRGSSYLPSEINAAFLWPQLEQAQNIMKRRLEIWKRYYSELSTVVDTSDLPTIPQGCEHNAHMFYLKLKDLRQRSEFIHYLKEKGISAVFHYVPLHSSPAGKKYGDFTGSDNFTTKESERLVRLPLFYNMTEEEQAIVIAAVQSFFKR